MTLLEIIAEINDHCGSLHFMENDTFNLISYFNRNELKPPIQLIISGFKPELTHNVKNNPIKYLYYFKHFLLEEYSMYSKLFLGLELRYYDSNISDTFIIL